MDELRPRERRLAPEFRATSLGRCSATTRAFNDQAARKLGPAADTVNTTRPADVVVTAHGSARLCHRNVRAQVSTVRACAAADRR